MSDISPVISFLFQSVLITLPGLFTPGPVTAITVERGTVSPHAGAFVTMGHGVVELPFVILLFTGLGRFTGYSSVRVVLALAGGAFLLYMAWKTFRSRNALPVKSAGAFRSSFSAGMFMTIANPFLLLWWGTVGSTLIFRAIEFGAAASVLFYVFHISANFIWFYILSFLSFKGYMIMGRVYRFAVSIICGGILSGFGVYFIITAFKILNI
ncbi:MAG TPA: LysE family transporter [Spirochaetota bacterium]|nr:LysE family transporter [Bacteroidales bacterium]HRX49388.1 LysE family transporter [Spirochaetota bacterium]